MLFAFIKVYTFCYLYTKKIYPQKKLRRQLSACYTCSQYDFHKIQIRSVTPFTNGKETLKQNSMPKLKALVINSYVLFGCSWGIRVNGKMRVFNKLVITIVACFIKDIETWLKYVISQVRDSLLEISNPPWQGLWFFERLDFLVAWSVSWKKNNNLGHFSNSNSIEKLITRKRED